MKKRLILFSILNFFALSTSWAKECTDKTTLDQLVDEHFQIKKRMTISLIEALDLTAVYNEGSYLQYVRLSKQGTVLDYRSDWQIILRGIELSFNSSSLQQKTVQPFTCEITHLDYTSHGDPQKREGFFAKDINCPLYYFYPKHAMVDEFPLPMSLESLKYNLGNKFKVTAECD